MEQTRLRQVLSEAMKPGGNIEAARKVIGEAPIATPEDARAVVGAVKMIRAEHFQQKNGVASLVELFEQAGTQEAFDVLSMEGIPLLIELFDRAEGGAELKLYLLKIFALYRSVEGAERIIKAARRPLETEAYLWSVIFGCLRVGHPLTVKIGQALAAPLPEKFIGVAYLDLVNRAARKSGGGRHAFDTDEGVARLEEYLRLPDRRQHTYADSAATALPFLHHAKRDALLALALEHADAKVQMRGAWAAAKLGSEAGARLLSQVCLDPRHSQAAWGYLEELKRHELIPIEAQRGDFRAMAEMCNWLSHPMERGRPPDEVGIFDTREMDWAPTKDRRRLWLVKFLYRAEGEGKVDEVGVGMVGSITFCLAGKMTAEMAAEEIYGLHCSWELERKGGEE